MYRRENFLTPRSQKWKISNVAVAVVFPYRGETIWRKRNIFTEDQYQNMNALREQAQTWTSTDGPSVMMFPPAASPWKHVCCWKFLQSQGPGHAKVAGGEAIFFN